VAFVLSFFLFFLPASVLSFFLFFLPTSHSFFLGSSCFLPSCPPALLPITSYIFVPFRSLWSRPPPVLPKSYLPTNAQHPRSPPKSIHNMGGQSKPGVPAEQPRRHQNITPHLHDQAGHPTYPHFPPSFHPGPHYPPKDASHPKDQNKSNSKINLPHPSPTRDANASTASPADQVRGKLILHPSIDDYVAPASEFFAGRRDPDSQRHHGVRRYLDDWNHVWDKIARNDARSGHGSGSGKGKGKGKGNGKLH
jgi:hypothetical protein